MITIRDHQTGDLFDPWAHLGSKRRDLLSRGWAGVFRTHLLRELPVCEFAKSFSQGKGRPSKDLHVVAGVLVLQQLHDLTDAATVEALAFNLAWHYALDLREGSDAYICERSLRNYRRIVVERGLDEVLFRDLTDRLLAAFGVDVSRQRMDSTSIRSAMRTLTRLGILVETLTKFLRELSRECPDRYETVPVEILSRYVDRSGGHVFALSKPSESKRRLGEAAQDLWDILERFRGTEAQSLSTYDLLRRVFHEHIDVVQEPGAAQQIFVKEPRAVSCESVQNPSDPDASYNTRRGQGYRAQVMETYSERSGDEVDLKPDLITHVSVTSMTRHDGGELEAGLQDVVERGVAPRQVVADSHYGDKDNVEKAGEQGIELIAPAMTAKGAKQGKLTLEQFELDENGCVNTCPMGHSPVSVSRSAKRLEARFEGTGCRACAQLAICPARLEGGRARLQYTPERLYHRDRRLTQKRPAFKDRYRWRAGVEATISRLKHQMRLAYLRVRGEASVKYAIFLRALGLNIRRCATTLQTA